MGHQRSVACLFLVFFARFTRDFPFRAVMSETVYCLVLFPVFRQMEIAIESKKSDEWDRFCRMHDDNSPCHASAPLPQILAYYYGFHDPDNKKNEKSA